MQIIWVARVRLAIAAVDRLLFLPGSDELCFRRNQMARPKREIFNSWFAHHEVVPTITWGFPHKPLRPDDMLVD